MARATITESFESTPQPPPRMSWKLSCDEGGFGSQMGRAAERASNVGVPTQSRDLRKEYSATSYTFTLPLGIVCCDEQSQ